MAAAEQDTVYGQEAFVPVALLPTVAPSIPEAAGKPRTASSVGLPESYSPGIWGTVFVPDSGS